MKIIRNLLTICLTLITFCNATAQDNSASVPKLTFDCAKANNTIPASDLVNCKKLILTGSENYEKVKIIMAIISFKLKGNIKEFKLKDDVIFNELNSSLSKLTPGTKITIESIRVSVPDSKTGNATIRQLPATSLIVK